MSSLDDRIDALMGVMNALPTDVLHKSILAGGAVRAVFDGTEVKDYDLFFRSKEDAAHVESWFLRHAEFVPEESYPTAFAHRLNGKLFNLVLFGFGEPIDILDSFDFRACQIAYSWPADADGMVLTQAPMAVSDAIEKRLFVVNNNGNERTLKRIKHYVEDYGYTLEVPVDATKVDIELKLDVVRAALASMPRSGRGSTGGYG